MKTGLVLPDLLIENVYDIFSFFNFNNISIFTDDIHDLDKLVGISNIGKLIDKIINREVLIVIVYEFKYFDFNIINDLILICHNNQCKLYLMSKK